MFFQNFSKKTYVIIKIEKGAQKIFEYLFLFQFANLLN